MLRRMKQYSIFFIAALGLLLAAINATSVAVAFPLIRTSFRTSLIVTAWVIGIYQLTAMVVMPIVGKASDTLGRRRIWLSSLTLFTAGSLGSALAPNIIFLIGARLIQALGGGGFFSSANGLVADEYPHRRQQIIGLFTSIFAAGQVIGPNIGGWLVSTYGWRAAFWFNVPLGLAILVLSYFVIPDRAPGPRGARIDIPGTMLLAATIAFLMLGISLTGYAEAGIAPGVIGACFLVSIASLAVFVVHSRRTVNAIIEFDLLTRRPFVMANLYNFFYGFSVFGLASFLPLYGISVYGLSTLGSGMFLTPRSVGMVVASAITSVMIMRLGYRRPMIWGTLLLIAGLALLGLQPRVTSVFGVAIDPLYPVLGFVFLLGVGSGMAAPASNNACIELMPERVATITGLRGMFRQGGGALGVSLSSLVLQHAGDLAHGFRVIFFGISIILLLNIPVIFFMPRAPKSNS